MAGVASKWPKKCQSTRQVSFCDAVPSLHPNASPQMHRARILLGLLPRMSCAQWSLAMRKLHNSHPVEGAAATSWICSTLARGNLPKPERKRLRKAANRLMNESVGMRKVGKLWSSESAWDAVHGEPARVLPRYHSAESFFLRQKH